jgi:hypothetical protein
MYLAAQRVPADQVETAVRDYRSFLGRYPNGLLSVPARERLADAYRRWGDQQTGAGDYDGGIGKYATVLQDFSATKVASAVQSRVQDLLDEARTKGRTSRRACDALQVLETLVADGLFEEEAHGSLATAYYQCARAEVGDKEAGSAVEHLRTLLHDFPKTSLRGKATSLLVQARVDQVRRGSHVKLGGPQRTGGAPAGQVVLSFRNSSPHRFELLVSGPVSESMTVGKCSTCRQYEAGHEPAFCPGTGPTLTLTLPPGTYSVVFHDPDTETTKDAYDVWTLASGNEYGGCNLLTKTR